jgi:NADPH:quinone reductase-like Zn-dependent oxidoreductase
MVWCMKAIRISAPVGVEGLVYEDAPDPEPAIGDEVYGLIDGYRDGWAAELIAIEARDVAPAPTTIDPSPVSARARDIRSVSALAAQFLDVAVSTSSTALTIPTSTDGEAATRR